jgi:hypothetical protein
VELDPKRTLIFGKNDTGKSSLIKTIFSTFGANPSKVNSNWKALNPISFVRFSVDDVDYSIMKDNKLYAIFNNRNEIIKLCNSVTNELGPFIAELLNFRIKLPDANNEIITPPPAFIFLPFYIDQDTGWSANWSSFAGIRQLKNPREPIIYYHTGIRGNDYYDTKNESSKYEEEYIDLQAEKKITQNLVLNLKEKISSIDFNINIEIFKEEIEELLIECDKLKKIEELHKTKLVDLYNKKIVLNAQALITNKALNESQKDYNFAAHKLDDMVECPTCGAAYENSFAERFEIASDRQRCTELLMEINQELIETNAQIDKENNSLNKTIGEITKIEFVLQKKRGEIQLKDVIENAGRNEVREILGNSLSQLNTQLVKNGEKRIELEAKWKAIENKDRKNEIELFYLIAMKKNLDALEVKSLSTDAYKGVISKVNDTGSSLPRALMAYYFAIFETMRKYSTSAFCPLVIDSPNQQAQDKGHIDTIYEFIKQSQPKDVQMILGLEDLYNIEFDCPIVELKDKLSLLNKGEYEEVEELLNPFYRQILQNKGLLF